MLIRPKFIDTKIKDLYTHKKCLTVCLHYWMTWVCPLSSIAFGNSFIIFSKIHFIEAQYLLLNSENISELVRVLKEKIVFNTELLSVRTYIFWNYRMVWMFIHCDINIPNVVRLERDVAKTTNQRRVFLGFSKVSPHLMSLYRSLWT